MTQVTIDISNDLPLLQDNVETLTERLGDLTTLMESIQGILIDNTRKRFTDKKDPNGVAWANLMPSTQARKGNNNILVKGGALQLITGSFDKYSVTVGTDMTYGVYHQFGTEKMTARPFLGLSDDDKEEIYELINEILMQD